MLFNHRKINNFSSSKKHYVLSLMVFVFSFILFLLCILAIMHAQRNKEEQALLDVSVRDSDQFISQVINAMVESFPLMHEDCSSARVPFQRQAAFIDGVRTFLLVDTNNMIVCSSATGAMQLPVKELVPKLNTKQKQDMYLLPETPLVHDKPVLMLWVNNPASNEGGILATIEGDRILYLINQKRNNLLPPVSFGVHSWVLSSSSPTLIAEEQFATMEKKQIPNTPAYLQLNNSQLSITDKRTCLYISLLLAVCFTVGFYYFFLPRHLQQKKFNLAMKNKQFYLVYQPIIYSSNKEIHGIEVLVRWQHPRLGLIPPDKFIAEAEEIGSITQLTKHIFQLLIDDIPQLAEILPSGSQLSVNISHLHLQEERFRQDIEQLQEYITRYPLGLIMEITERGMVDYNHAQREFSWLRQQKIGISIDDFGTGHSALAYLRHYTIDYLKIDRIFVQDIQSLDEDVPILDTILTLAKKLRLHTVAEGVETELQADYLAKHQVEFLQGYLFSKPLQLADLKKFIYNNTQNQSD